MPSKEDIIRFLDPDFPQCKSLIIGECQRIKVGRVLIVGEVTLFSDGNERPVAHVVGTCSIPPKH